jgi:hypothetical protein
MDAQPGQANPEAFRVGHLAQDLFDSYFMHEAAMLVARDPRAAALLPAVEAGSLVPVARVRRKDGGEQSFHLRHYLERAQDRHPDEFSRVFLAGGLLTIGDSLKSEEYFDHAPELELVRHLRNGVAHGNTFNFDKSGRWNLSHYPAHNRFAWAQNPLHCFEVTAAMHRQPVLWDFMDPGDVLSLLQWRSVLRKPELDQLD